VDGAWWVMVRCGPTMQCASPAFFLKKFIGGNFTKKKKNSKQIKNRK